MNRGAKPLSHDELRRVVEHGREFVESITWYAAKYRKPGFHPGEAIEPILEAARRLWMATEGRTPAELIPRGFCWDLIVSCTAAEVEQRTPLRMARENLRFLLRRIGCRNDDVNPNLPSTRGLDLEPDDSLPELADLIDALDELARRIGPEPDQAPQEDETSSMAAAESRTRKNRKAADTDRLLVKAIKRLRDAAEFGLKRSTIAKRAGVPRQTAIKRFDDKASKAAYAWDDYERDSFSRIKRQ